jgi:23S rRNA (uracil1939-C5)-methyltransferase
VSDKVFNLDIDDLAYGPYGVGHKDRLVVLVPFTAPGDQGEIEIVQKKPNYAVGRMTRLLRESSFRQTPACAYFTECGGCAWQHVAYETQLAAKETLVADALRRIGKLKDFEIMPIIASPSPYRYRGRVRFHVGRDGRLGFHKAFSHELVEVQSCPVAEPAVEALFESAREWSASLRTAIREIELVAGAEGAPGVLAAKAAGDFKPEDDAGAADLLARCPEIAGLILSGPKWRREWGRTATDGDLNGGLSLRFDGGIFAQINRHANREVIRRLLDWGEFGPADRVLELFSGAGNLTLPMARLATAVTAVESNRRAVANGKSNARLNGIDNINWLSADAQKTVATLLQRGERFSKVVLNPPRHGAKELAHKVAEFSPRKILYVSCHPPTLARDLSAIAKTGYRLRRVQPVDMFPQTFHVEAVAEMDRDEC